MEQSCFGDMILGIALSREKGWLNNSEIGIMIFEFGFFIHPHSTIYHSYTFGPRQRGTLNLTLFEINECTLSPAGGGSSAMKRNFQMGVDKEDINDEIIIIILVFK